MVVTLNEDQTDRQTIRGQVENVRCGCIVYGSVTTYNDGDDYLHRRRPLPASQHFAPSAPSPAG